MALDDLISQQEKMTKEIWANIAGENVSSFFENFPFFDDPKFLKLPPIHQRFLLAMTLKEVWGFTLSDAYRFASRRPETTNSTARGSANSILKTARVKYFVDKLDWARVENLGFTTKNIIKAETELAYSDITTYLDDDGLFIGNLKDLPVDVRRAIKSFDVQEHRDKAGNLVRKYKLTLWDKGASLQRMQKMKGLQIDNVHTENTTLQITKEMSAEEASKAYADMMRDDS